MIRLLIFLLIVILILAACVLLALSRVPVTSTTARLVPGTAIPAPTATPASADPAAWTVNVPIE